MSDYSELKRLAEGLEAHAEDSFYLPCTIAFERAATPAAVLALIAEVDRLTADNTSLRGSCAKLGAEHAGMVRQIKKLKGAKP